MIDFDDLDEAAANAVSEGQLLSDAAKQALGGFCGGVLPLMPKKPPIIPGLEHLPERLLNIFPSGSERNVRIRLFVFYGAGDQFAGWANFMHNAPPWCEVAVHEWPFHGIREEARAADSLNALVEDAFHGLEEALRQHARGGCVAGAPFALAGHSIGALQMVGLAQRIRAELGLEPAAVYVLDRASPEHSLCSERGREMLRTDLVSFVCRIDERVARARQEDSAKGRRMVEMWKELRFQDNTWPLGFHTFHCPLHVFIAMQNWAWDTSEAKAMMSPEERTHQEERSMLLGTKGGSSALFDREAYDSWCGWTSNACQLWEIDTHHVGIKTHKAVLDIMWRSLEAAWTTGSAALAQDSS